MEYGNLASRSAKIVLQKRYLFTAPVAMEKLPVAV